MYTMVVKVAIKIVPGIVQLHKQCLVG